VWARNSDQARPKKPAGNKFFDIPMEARRITNWLRVHAVFPTGPDILLRNEFR
jgi:hypothetical protein